MYRILSLDGGGIRGLYPATVLRLLEEQRPGFIDSIDMFAGTSTGGIIALGLAAGVPIEKIEHIYKTRGGEIFKKDFWARLGVGKLFNSEYKNNGLKKILEEVLGESTILDDLDKKVLISTFRLNRKYFFNRTDSIQRGYRPKFYHNFEGPTSDGSWRVVDVAMMTSAAPTYFPSYRGHIDGGVVSNNPSVPAVAKALKEGASLDDVRVLSIGTLDDRNSIEGSTLNWGVIKWAKPLVSIMMDGVSEVNNYICTNVLKTNYFRVNSFIEGSPIPMDSSSPVDISRLSTAALTYDMGPLLEWVDTTWLE